MELKLGSEFHDSIADLCIRDQDVALACVPAPLHPHSSLQGEPIALKSKSFKHNGTVMVCCFLSPAVCGRYHLTARCSAVAAAEGAEGCQVLDLISDMFEVTTESAQISAAAVLLSNYRMLPLGAGVGAGAGGLLLKESYGLSLGAHIYDSAVVLAQHVAQLPACAGRSTVVELGAGCGLVGMAAALALALGQGTAGQVILTDMQQALPLLKENVLLNSLDGAVRCEELRWDDMQQIDRLLLSLLPAPEASVLFLAADVLYDQQGAKCFIAMMLRLLRACAGSACVVAQKNRQTLPAAALEEHWQGIEAGLRWSCLHDSMHVLLWQVSLAS